VAGLDILTDLQVFRPLEYEKVIFEMPHVCRLNSCTSAAACSRWLLDRGFFYPEEGGDTYPETLVHTISTQRHIEEDGILHVNSSSKNTNTKCQLSRKWHGWLDGLNTCKVLKSK
jgi:hypothetical protein